MKYNNYQRAFFISCMLHIFIFAGAAIIFAALPPTKAVQKIEIKMVNMNDYQESNGNSPAVSLQGMNSSSHMDKTADYGSPTPGNMPNDSTMRSQMTDAQKNVNTSLEASEVIKPQSTVPAAGSDSSSQSVVATSTGSQGSLTGTGKQVNSGIGGSTSGSGTLGTGLSGGNFSSNGDGTYTALSSTGIDYTILNSVEAEYPEEARAVGYTRNIRVEAVILVGLDGNVESVSILNNVPNLGFREAARQALLQWKFSPIYYQGTNIKMKFYKNIYFEPS